MHLQAPAAARQVASALLHVVVEAGLRMRRLAAAPHALREKWSPTASEPASVPVPMSADADAGADAAPVQASLELPIPEAVATGESDRGDLVAGPETPATAWLVTAVVDALGASPANRRSRLQAAWAAAVFADGVGIGAWARHTVLMHYALTCPGTPCLRGSCLARWGWGKAIRMPAPNGC